MGSHDEATAKAEQAQLAQLCAAYRQKHGPVSSAALEALIYQAINQSGIANLAGCSLESVGVATQLAGMRLVMEADQAAEVSVSATPPATVSASTPPGRAGLKLPTLGKLGL
jgi:hypothetical protein